MQILTSADLLKQQLEEIGTQPTKGVEPAVGLGISYNAKLQNIVREVKKDIDTQLTPLLRDLAPQYSTQDSATPTRTRDGWFDLIQGALQMLLSKWSSPEYRALADTLASTFVGDASDINYKRTQKSFGVNILAGEPSLDEYLQAAAYNNSQLIKSIPAQYLGQVENIVLTNVRAGGRPAAIESLLRDQFGVTQNRAKFIARDQTSKINGDLTARRQQNAGFDYFQWVDSNDSRVRDRHEAIADKVTAYGKGVYRWDNPPLSDKGDPIIPGQDYGCRCIARPVRNATVEKNQRDGKVTPGVYR